MGICPEREEISRHDEFGVRKRLGLEIIIGTDGGHASARTLDLHHFNVTSCLCEGHAQVASGLPAKIRFLGDLASAAATKILSIVNSIVNVFRHE